MLYSKSEAHFLAHNLKFTNRRAGGVCVYVLGGGGYAFLSPQLFTTTLWLLLETDSSRGHALSLLSDTANEDKYLAAFGGMYIERSPRLLCVAL